MYSNTLITYLVPAFVAVLTAVGGVIGLSLRDADAYERRRGLWLWMLVFGTAIVTMAAMNTATGVGRPIPAVGLTVSACAAAIGTHFLWRRIVPDAEPRTVVLARASIGLAVAIIIASVSLTYVAGKGCRQAEPLTSAAIAQSGYILPSFAGQGPTPGEFADWANELREKADAVTAGDTAGHAKRLVSIADEITAAVRDGDTGGHAVLGAEFYEVLKAILSECYPQ
ncbi:MAG: hypothetical protein ACSLE3_00355 [Microbacteriaceae bacterium]